MKAHYPGCELGDRCTCDEIDALPDSSEIKQNAERIRAEIEL